MGRSQLKRLKELEKKNQRLLRAVSDLKLDKLIMQEAAMGSDGRLGIDPVDQFRPERAEPMSPSSFRKCIEHVRQELGVSELVPAAPWVSTARHRERFRKAGPMKSG